MKLNPIQACVSAASLFAHPSLSICSVAIMIGIMASPAHAELASQAVPIQYKPGAYCSTDTKAVIPVIAKGTQNKAFVADVFCIREQLQPYQAEHQPINTRFQAYKADAWLSYVAHERNEASLTKASRYALAEALSIVEALKTNQVDKLPLTADIPPTSGLQRPDLWASLLTIKQTPAFTPLVKTVADSEVKLIWAEAEFCEFGWRHSREHYNTVDRWVATAELTALNASSVDKQSFNALKTQYLTRLKPLTATKNSKESCRGAVLPYIELPKVGMAEPSPQPLPLPVVVPVASPH